MQQYRSLCSSKKKNNKINDNFHSDQLTSAFNVLAPELFFFLILSPPV